MNTETQLTVVEFLGMRASEFGAAPRGEELWALIATHVPASCGRHCDGHDDEAFPVWPCDSLLRAAAQFEHHPDYSAEAPA